MHQTQIRHEILDRLLARSQRPERLIAGSLILHATLILTGVAVTGGISSPILPWIAIPVVAVLSAALALFGLRMRINEYR